MSGVNSTPFIDLDSEVWRPIAGFEGLYEVSNMGRLRRVRDWRTRGGLRCKAPFLLKPSLKTGEGNGRYLNIVLTKEGKRHGFLVASLVARAFLPPRPVGMELNHIDGVKANNRSDNLEWLTHKGNVHHAIRLGLKIPVRGERRNSKLTAEKVLQIRARAKAGEVQTRIAESFNVTPTLVSLVVLRRIWKHVV